MSSDETLQTAESQNNQVWNKSKVSLGWSNIFQAYTNYNYNQDTNNYYTDYGYPVQEQDQGLLYNPLTFNTERQGLEFFLTAPLVITAFIAALFGGENMAKK